MVIRTMEMLFEYISLVLCIQRIVKKKFKIDCWVIGLFILEWVLMLAITEKAIASYSRLFIHICFLMYIKSKVVGTWSKAIGTYGMALIVIMSFQIVFYYLFKVVAISGVLVQYKEIVSNVIICCFFFAWKEAYNKIIIDFIYKKKQYIIALMYVVILFRILYLCNQNGYAEFEITMQFLFETMGVSIAAILWINAEAKNKHREMEIQMYETYNNAFEEAIATIRTRQHEFENHINAIRCLQYTIKEPEQLIMAQEEYCNKVLESNAINGLLKLQIEPVLIGLLFSKITAANEEKIDVKYEIQPVNFTEKIAIYEFMEIIGILFDNAIEALNEVNKKIIIFKLLMDGENAFMLEIANISRIYRNSEIEKFCTYGYSTKGEKRGVGMTRVKELVKKSNATLLIQNCIYDSDNYLSFQIKME